MGSDVWTEPTPLPVSTSFHQMLLSSFLLDRHLQIRGKGEENAHVHLMKISSSIFPTTTLPHLNEAHICISFFSLSS